MRCFVVTDSDILYHPRVIARLTSCMHVAAGILSSVMKVLMADQ